jgi:hypothetical protein
VAVCPAAIIHRCLTTSELSLRKGRAAASRLGTVVVGTDGGTYDSVHIVKDLSRDICGAGIKSNYREA